MMLKIAVVGDLSMQNPKRFQVVLDAALVNADVVVQVGDMHPAYDIVANRLQTGRLLVIPGNHDAQFDALHQPRFWRKDFPQAHLVGLDNSHDTYTKEEWDMLREFPATVKLPLFVFTHKPLSQIVLSDGSESGHIMGEGVSGPNADADRLKTWLVQHRPLVVCGHYHEWVFMRTPYSDVLVDGRGGANPNELGYTVINVLNEGWSIHKVTLPE
jgi:predicted phosphodiesterase